MENKNVITNEELQKLIRADQQERANAALADIQAALKRHSCTLSIFLEVTMDGKVKPGYKITAL